jgi:tetratricopeptide (TPR) repeat protein
MTVLKWLLKRSQLVCSSQPERALPLALSALDIARQRDACLDDKACLARALDVLAWCYLNLRDFSRAEEVLGELEALSRNVVQSGELRERYLTTQGFYYGLIGFPERACSLLSSVLEMRRESGRRRDVVCSLVNLASVELDRGRADRAIQLYGDALELLDREKDPPRLQIAVYSYLVLAHCEASQPRKARALLPKARDLAKVVGGWYWSTYVEWLEGTLARVEGRFDEARVIFESVRATFLKRGHAVWYTEASLDLARVYLAEERMGCLEELASELEARVEVLKAEERVRSAVRSFAESVRKQALTGRLLASLAFALSFGRANGRGGA